MKEEVRHFGRMLWWFFRNKNVRKDLQYVVRKEERRREIKRIRAKPSTYTLKAEPGHIGVKPTEK